MMETKGNCSTQEKGIRRRRRRGLSWQRDEEVIFTRESIAKGGPLNAHQEEDEVGRRRRWWSLLVKIERGPFNTLKIDVNHGPRRRLSFFVIKIEEDGKLCYEFIRK